MKYCGTINSFVSALLCKTTEPPVKLPEDGTGMNHPKRPKKPLFKVIQNKLVETENHLEDLWKRCLKQIKR